MDMAKKTRRPDTDEYGMTEAEHVAAGRAYVERELAKRSRSSKPGLRQQAQEHVVMTGGLMGIVCGFLRGLSHATQVRKK